MDLTHGSHTSCLNSWVQGSPARFFVNYRYEIFFLLSFRLIYKYAMWCEGGWYLSPGHFCPMCTLLVIPDAAQALSMKAQEILYYFSAQVVRKQIDITSTLHNSWCGLPRILCNFE